MILAAVAAIVFLASPSFTTLSTAATFEGNIEASKKQLRGVSRSMAALAPREPIIRFPDDEKSTRLPVSPGISDDVDPEDLPCLVETICDQPELSILCGFITSNLGEWNSTSGFDNFFLGEDMGTFLAPQDGAFEDHGTLLSHILSEDLANPIIVENVLAYHAIPIDETSNITDLLESLDDFECHGKLVMANGDASTTLCFNDFTRHQIGIGNMNMRNAPKIIEKGIEACDGTVFVHFVDELILPPLPLSGILEDLTSSETIPPSTFTSTSSSDASGVLSDLSSEFTETVVCPIAMPALGESCRDIGSCGYRYAYDGCSWADLQCVPSIVCSCFDIGEDGTGSWRCAIDMENTFKICPDPEPVELMTRSSEIISERPPPVDSRGLPTGRCDPNEPLPALPEECPAQKPESCRGYPAGKTCDFNHMYTGCTWEELECMEVEQCMCQRDGSWMCRTRGAQRCGSFDAELGWVDAELPEGLPWGRSCNPDEPLPKPPPIEVDVNDAVVGRLSNECPTRYNFGSCEGFEPNLQCKYNYEYDGCTWETLRCAPIMQCECGMFGDGNWACMSESRLFCPERLEGFPRGRCDPDEPIPLPPITTSIDVELSSASVSETEVAVSLISGGLR